MTRTVKEIRETQKLREEISGVRPVRRIREARETAELREQIRRFNESESGPVD